MKYVCPLHFVRSTLFTRTPNWNPHTELWRSWKNNEPSIRTSYYLRLSSNNVLYLSAIQPFIFFHLRNDSGLLFFHKFHKPIDCWFYKYKCLCFCRRYSEMWTSRVVKIKFLWQFLGRGAFVLSFCFSFVLFATSHLIFLDSPCSLFDWNKLLCCNKVYVPTSFCHTHPQVKMKQKTDSRYNESGK